MAVEIKCPRCKLSLGEVRTNGEEIARRAAHAEVCDPDFGKQ